MENLIIAGADIQAFRKEKNNGSVHVREREDGWRSDNSDSITPRQSPQRLRESNLDFESLLDIKLVRFWPKFCIFTNIFLKLAELKGIFDRFAIDGLLTIGETCQALTEAGVIVPRRDIFKQLRSRGIKGLQRNVNFFEFLYSYSSLRYEAFQAISSDKFIVFPLQMRL